MTIIQKILDLFKLPDTSNAASSIHTVASYTPNPKMEQYYKREQIKKENNSNITYQDMVIYDMKPFDLKQPFITDDHFTCIALNDYNLDMAYTYLHNANALIKPFHKHLKNAILPDTIDINYNTIVSKLPVSHLRLTPYTSTMRKCKYPFYLWLQYYGEHGDYYLYRLYFNQSGNFQKGDLSFTCKKAIISYQIQLRNDGIENYVRRIDRTSYIEPYGTTTLYIDDKRGK
jgi:hypothetical protein|nr:MAG TPA: hypothetical protein [Caudoviricetes sp.]